MSTETEHSIRGSTASSSIPGRTGDAAPPPGPPRHLVGSALRAVGVFLDTAFRVVVLGTDGTRQPDEPPKPAPLDAPDPASDPERGADRPGRPPRPRSER